MNLNGSHGDDRKKEEVEELYIKKIKKYYVNIWQCQKMYIYILGELRCEY